MPRNALASVLFFLLTGNAFAQSADWCPKLSADSGIRWQFQDGPDFSVCTATRQSDGKKLFGVYMGNHPSFHPEPDTKAANGVVGGIKVEWHFPPAEEQGATLLETVFDIPGPQPDMPLQSHVWVLPQRRVELPRTFRLLASMRY